jgi:hypothetical protein
VFQRCGIRPTIKIWQDVCHEPPPPPTPTPRAALGIGWQYNKSNAAIWLKIVASFAAVFLMWDVKPVFDLIWSPFRFFMGYSDPRRPVADHMHGEHGVTLCFVWGIAALCIGLGLLWLLLWLLFLFLFLFFVNAELCILSRAAHGLSGPTPRAALAQRATSWRADLRALIAGCALLARHQAAPGLRGGRNPWPLGLRTCCCPAPPPGAVAASFTPALFPLIPFPFFPRRVVFPVEPGPVRVDLGHGVRLPAPHLG